LGLERIEAELPPTLRQYARRVRLHLTQVETDIARARAQARRRRTRLLREASHELGRLEAWGEARWRKLTAPYRKRAVDLLRRLERAIEPATRKKAVRKKTARKKPVRRKTVRSKAVRKKTARKKVARRKGARKAAARR
jgi:hypothetical protein